MSVETYRTIAMGLLVFCGGTLLAALVSLALAIAGWGKTNRNRRLLLSCGLFILSGLVIASPTVLFKFVHFPTELTAENYEAVRHRMDAKASVESHIMPGEIAPPFSVTTEAGVSFALINCRGSIVLINFFRTDCGPCNLEMPVLQRIWDEYGEREDFQMIAISRGESIDAVTSYKKAHNLTFPLGVDTDASVYGLYASEGIPRTYLVGRDGTLLVQSLGFMGSDVYSGDEKRTRDMVSNALAKHQ